MGFAGGHPAQMRQASNRLTTLSSDLAADAVAITRVGGRAAAAAGSGLVGGAAESALAAIGGATIATSVIAGGLGEGVLTGADQLDRATSEAR